MTALAAVTFTGCGGTSAGQEAWDSLTNDEQAEFCVGIALTGDARVAASYWDTGLTGSDLSGFANAGQRHCEALTRGL